jgi:hypothetical protein
MASVSDRNGNIAPYGYLANLGLLGRIVLKGNMVEMLQ